jgi:uncharacterized membrane protein
MAKVKGSVHIEAAPEQVLETVLDIPGLPAVMPSLEKVWDVQGHGVGCTYQWQYKMSGVSFEGGAEIMEAGAGGVTLKTSGGIPSTWVYQFTPAAGGTDVKLSVEYTMPGSVLGAIADRLVVERQNQKEVNQALANIKARLEAD